MTPLEAVAIIPARGGSKRLPRKNVLPLLDRPILAYTVSAALESGVFDRVIVSTDDDEISATALAAGADVDRRDPTLATDVVGVVAVCTDLLGRLAQQGAPARTFCCLYATAALRTAQDIMQAHRLLEPGTCDFVMAVTEYHKTPFQALLHDEATDGLRFMWPDLAETPRWDHPRVVVDNGSTYWCTTEAFMKAGTFYGAGLRGYPMPRERSVDLDTMDDLALLEFYARRHLA